MSEPTQSKIFNLSDLIPEPLSFNDNALGGEGTRYDVRTAAMFSAEDYALVERIWGDIQGALSMPEGGTDAAIRLLEQRTNAFFQLLIPTMPPDRVAAIPFGFKFDFLKWWQAQQPQPDAKNARRASQPMRGTRSPGSSRSTGSRQTPS